MANNLHETDRLQSRIEKNVAKASKRKSPKKPKGRSAPRRGRGRLSRNLAVYYDSDQSSSNSDVPSCSTSQSSQGRSRSAYDPNTIVLDCDDEFIGGPAVSFTRNVAAATAVSLEDTMDLKVNVRVKGQIDYFYMNPVSYLCISIS